MAPKTLVYAVRHGETLWNTEGRLQGHGNSDLSPRGEAEAHALGKALSSVRFDALYSSDLERAIQTARILHEHVQGPEPKLEPQLRERSYGRLEGLTWAEVEQRFPETPIALIRGGPDTVPPGGEALPGFIERGFSALSAIAEKHPDQTVLAVSHGGVLATFLRRVMGVPLEQPHTFKTLNCAINIFEYQASQWSLRTWGARAHLGED